ncbi:hypothetical protein L202_08051 [Cryptococcus amylolentus CBS 6039]|uniref:Phosphodiesterase n=1 Tax=Cryptococcus amylolentus CBS 6039 TaxID=1295533 RepID=A0A1E3HB43_9TREE|nr:hypothetical protein L202_08051 [Cryptococcus amylolentus CBS 6039]ODN73553.1 hypothetical protein L202_08051 [Cryptococcus amylolentus CBS 6039]
MSFHPDQPPLPPAPTAPTSGGRSNAAPLNILVLLPSAVALSPTSTSPGPVDTLRPTRPGQSPVGGGGLMSRSSSSKVPTLSSLRESASASTSASEKRGAEVGSGGENGAGGTPAAVKKVKSSSKVGEEIQKQIIAGRRLSLGSGLGAGVVPPSLGVGSSGGAAGKAGELSINVHPPSSFLHSHAPGQGPSHKPLLSPLLSPTATSPGSTPAQGSSVSGFVPPQPPTLAAPPFGAKSRPFGSASLSGAAGSRSRRRPQTATGASGFDPTAPGAPGLSGIAPGLVAGTASARASLAVASGASSASRPGAGWEADELVGNLRGSGLEVTVIRALPHLTTILNPPTTSTAFTPHPIITRPTDEPLTNIILVPLADVPSFPSLSLLTNRGTTPTAVCFQQDILNRARRAEDKWLQGALAQIRRVGEMVPPDTNTTEEAEQGKGQPLIMAYSANPALSQNAISACLSAGAIGVLRPPYGPDTASTVRRMAESYKDGGAVDVQSPGHSASPAVGGGAESVHSNHRSSFSASAMSGEERSVVLPPTALSMGMGGGEQEGERVLSAAVGSSRRGSTSSWHCDSKRNSISFEPSLPGSASRKGSVQYGVNFASDPFGSACTCASPALLAQHPKLTQDPPALLTSKDPLQSPAPTDAFPYLYDQATVFCASHPGGQGQLKPDPRRRSVDVGGLALAIKRASRMYDTAAMEGGVPGIGIVAPKSFSLNAHAGAGDKLGQIHEGYSFPSVSPTTDITDRIDHKSPTSPGIWTETSAENDAWGKYTELAELLSALYYQTGATVEVQMEEYELLSKPLTKEERVRLVDKMATWDFKPHDLEEGDLYRVACILFEGVLNTEGLAHLGLERDKVNRLLYALRAIYHAPNPYHNYVHAIDVLQATYTFLLDIGVVPPFDYLREWPDKDQGEKEVWTRMKEGGESRGTKRARELIRPQDVLAVLVAAMGHDVGHPGLSNAFMKNAKVPLSQVYEDKSVLENMHCMLVVQLLRKHGFGFLIESSTPSCLARATESGIDQKGFRKVLYSSILATDMSLHFAWIARLKEFDERLREGVVGGEEEERVLICQALIKSADISNPSRPIDVSQHWSSVLLEEWAKQASLEHDLSLPVSVVASADAALQAKGQIGFIDLFTKPLFDAVSDALPELQRYADSCANNQAVWKARLDALMEDDEEEGEAARMVVQPVIEGASLDGRFRTLFPLLLPSALLANLNNKTADVTPRSTSPLPPSPSKPLLSPFAPPTPSTFSFRSEQIKEGTPASPTANVMRAVYHGKLVDQPTRSKLTSWSRGFGHGHGGSGNWNEARRMSTPEVLTGRDQL